MENANSAQTTVVPVLQAIPISYLGTVMRNRSPSATDLNNGTVSDSSDSGNSSNNNNNLSTNFTIPNAPKQQRQQQQFCVRWNGHLGSLGAAFPQLLAGQHFVDVTLACEGHQLHCHKLVLAACSSYFEIILGENPCKHPIVILPPEIKLWVIQALVDFMYKGEVNVSQAGLSDLLKCANLLQIRGLIGAAYDATCNGFISNQQQPVGATNNSQFLAASTTDANDDVHTNKPHLIQLPKMNQFNCQSLIPSPSFQSLHACASEPITVDNPNSSAALGSSSGVAAPSTDGASRVDGSSNVDSSNNPSSLQLEQQKKIQLLQENECLNNHVKRILLANPLLMSHLPSVSNNVDVKNLTANQTSLINFSDNETKNSTNNQNDNKNMSTTDDYTIMITNDSNVERRSLKTHHMTRKEITNSDMKIRQIVEKNFGKSKSISNNPCTPTNVQCDNNMANENNNNDSSRDLKILDIKLSTIKDSNSTIDDNNSDNYFHWYISTTNTTVSASEKYDQSILSKPSANSAIVIGKGNKCSDNDKLDSLTNAAAPAIVPKSEYVNINVIENVHDANETICYNIDDDDDPELMDCERSSRDEEYNDNYYMQLKREIAPVGRKKRRSESVLRQAAECVTKGQTFQTVSDMFGIPISTIRFFMARKGILPRRKRGRSAGFSLVGNLGSSLTNELINFASAVTDTSPIKPQTNITTTVALTRSQAAPREHRNATACEHFLPSPAPSEPLVKKETSIEIDVDQQVMSRRSISPQGSLHNFSNYQLPDLKPRLH